MTNPFEHLRDQGDTAPLFFAICTGAGAGLQKLIWEVPGVSNFFVGAAMPYAMEETSNLLGFTPDLSPRGRPEYVSVNTAVDLAMTAYMRAWKPGRRAIGFGMTCSVASKVAHKHGDHRVIASIFSDEGCWVISTVIPKGEGEIQRKLDGMLSDKIASELIAWYLSARVESEAPTFEGCKVELRCVDSLAHDRLMAHPFFKADGTRGPLTAIDPKKTLFYPGAYNPPHEGHFQSGAASLETLAVEKEHRTLVFSTTVNPPHKPALSTAECLQRAKLMKGHNFIVTEGDPRFLEKARKFPGAHFVMGADAMDRMLDPKWGFEIRPMLDEFASIGTRFLVPGRLVGTEFLVCGRVMSNHMADVLGRTSLFIPVDFRLDLSSSEIRAKNGETKSIKLDSAELTAMAAACAKEG